MRIFLCLRSYFFSEKINRRGGIAPMREYPKQKIKNSQREKQQHPALKQDAVEPVGTKRCKDCKGIRRLNNQGSYGSRLGTCGDHAECSETPDKPRERKTHIVLRRSVQRVQKRHSAVYISAGFYHARDLGNHPLGLGTMLKQGYGKHHIA